MNWKALTTLSITLCCSALSLAQVSNKWWLRKDQVAVECCRCVPFYACQDNYIDETKLKDGDKNTTIVNVEFCPNPVDFCCMNREHHEECKDYPIGKMPKSINKDPRPDVPCECALWETCPLENIVTDGKGSSNQMLEEIGLVTHSKCSEALEVCCERKSAISIRIGTPPIVPLDTPMGMRMSEGGECQCVHFSNCDTSSFSSTEAPNTDGVGIIEPRSNVKCQDANEICCNPESVIGFSHSDGSRTETFRSFFLCSFVLLLTSII